MNNFLTTIFLLISFVSFGQTETLTNSGASNPFSLSAYGDSANIKLTARNEL